MDVAIILMYLLFLVAKVYVSCFFGSTSEHIFFSESIQSFKGEFNAFIFPFVFNLFVMMCNDPSY